MSIKEYSRRARLGLVATLFAAGRAFRKTEEPDTMQSKNTAGRIYSFTMNTLDGKPKSLGEFKGRAVMIVNVASKCGLTPQYADLQSLYGDYKDRGLSIAAFPANEFGAQEPGTNQEIGAFCAKNYGVSFDVFEKIVVKGAGQHPLYGYLTRESGFPGEIEWNFAKFLVDKSGRVVARFNAETNPRAADVVAAVEKALA